MRIKVVSAVRYISIVFLVCACPATVHPAENERRGLNGVTADTVTDAGRSFDAAKLNAYVKFQTALRTAAIDAGSDALAGARSEDAIRRDNGLSVDDVDRIEDMIFTIITETELARTLRRLSADEPLPDFEALTDAQRKKLERVDSALADAGALIGSKSDLERRYGAGAVSLILAREKELVRFVDAEMSNDH